MYSDGIIKPMNGTNWFLVSPFNIICYTFFWLLSDIVGYTYSELIPEIICYTFFKLLSDIILLCHLMTQFLAGKPVMRDFSNIVALFFSVNSAV